MNSYSSAAAWSCSLQLRSDSADSQCLLFPFVCCPQDEEVVQLMQQPQIPIKPASTPLKADESEMKVAETGAAAAAAQPPAASS